ncbi:hypothetical protein EVAR_32945_1 [Eumeta japonica]|uniref:Uncharacterized protein n=1 Tax=Eumeta variegata TaxID=151549 RepID=A0A4C1X6N2_EUMVA|nr:hypothetical protein EVAR_32945_1 [Eumeta japonica]
MDDLQRLPLPNGVRIITCADGMSVLIGVHTKLAIETKARKGIFVATIKYVASCWVDRVDTYVTRSTLLRGQRSSLILLTKPYGSVSTAALPVLADIVPVDFGMARSHQG